MVKQFVPLESSPQVFNQLMYSLGVSRDVTFNDVFSLDPEMLAFYSRPVYALIMTFPVSDNYESYRHNADKHLADDYYNEISGTDQEKALWYKQTIRNACGTMALIHALANGLPTSKIEPGSAIDQIIEQSAGCNTKDRALVLENSDALEALHSQVAHLGDTQAPAADAHVEHHYVCLTKRDGHLYELDGRRKGPIDLGPLADDEDLFCPQALKVVQEFMDRETTPAFSILALGDS